MFRHHQIARAELRDAERRLHEREIVDRAKAILIKERRMGEPDAYRWLRTRAMSSGRRIPDIAREVVARENVQVLSVNPASAPATTQGSNTQGSNTQGSYTQGSNTMGAEAQDRGAQ